MAATADNEKQSRTDDNDMNYQHILPEFRYRRDMWLSVTAHPSVQKIHVIPTNKQNMYITPHLFKNSWPQDRVSL